MTETTYIESHHASHKLAGNVPTTGMQLSRDIRHT